MTYSTSLTRKGWQYHIRDRQGMPLHHAGGFRSQSEAQLEALAWIASMK